MKKFLYIAVAAVAALSSCSSDTDLLNDAAGKGPKVFTARFEGTNSRATLNGMTPNWEADDVISINGAEYKAKTAGATSEFEATGAEAEGNTYTAYFPASLYNGGTPTLPATLNLTYEAGKFNMPMYATSSTNSLTFSNLCGVLAITVKSEQMAAVKSIKVSSQNYAVSGAFTVENGAAVLTDATTVANTLTVNYSTAVPTTAEGTVFYVAVPAQTYQDLKVELSEDGTTFTKSMTTKTGTDIIVERNNIYYVTLPTSSEWVRQLALGKTTATNIKIETNATSLPTADLSGQIRMLDNEGKLWEVLEGNTLTIKTSEDKILAKNNTITTFKGYNTVTTIDGLDKIDTSKMESMANMFNDCNALTTLDLSSFDTSNVKNMNYMFLGCKALTTLNLSHFNTSKVESMSGMFNNCAGLTTLDLSCFDTSNVTGMKDMFNGCKALTTLNLSSFNTAKVTTMFKMFYQCNALTNLNISNFNTEKVTDMQGMFFECKKLTSLDLSHFNTSKVTTMATMFSACETLTTLNLSSFNTANVTNMMQMFYNCFLLCSLTLSDNFKIPSSNLLMFNSTAKDVSEFIIYGVTSDDRKSALRTAFGATNPKLKFDGE